MDMEITMAMHCHVKRGMSKVAKGTDDGCEWLSCMHEEVGGREWVHEAQLLVVREKGIWAYKHSDMGREKMSKMMENMQGMG